LRVSPESERPPARRPFRNLIRCFDQAATKAAVFFRFLRHPSRPNAPRPVAKSGRAAERLAFYKATESVVQLTDAGDDGIFP